MVTLRFSKNFGMKIAVIEGKISQEKGTPPERVGRKASGPLQTESGAALLPEPVLPGGEWVFLLSKVRLAYGNQRRAFQ